MKNSRVLKRALEWKSTMESGHKRRENVQLRTLSKVQKPLKHLLMRETESDMTMCMVILGGTKFFLRIEEALCLTVEHFVHKLFQVDPNVARALVVHHPPRRGNVTNTLFCLTFVQKPSSIGFFICHVI
jgi:hypothetical protein